MSEDIREGKYRGHSNLEIMILTLLSIGSTRSFHSYEIVLDCDHVSTEWGQLSHLPIHTA